MENINNIVFPNVHEFMCMGMDSGYASLSEWRNIAAGYSEISILWQGRNKLILAPKPIDGGLISYHKAQFGYEINCVTPEAFTSETANNFISDARALKAIEDFAKARSPVGFISWGGTPGAYALLNKIKKANPFMRRRFARAA